MSDLTRQQVEELRNGTRCVHSGDFDRLCAMALRSLDHAADARLGSRAREALVSCGLSDPRFLERVALELRAPVSANAGHPWAHHSALADVVTTVAQTLREEQADAVRGEGR